MLRDWLLRIGFVLGCYALGEWLLPAAAPMTVGGVTVQAAYVWWVQVILLVVSLYISYAARSKIKPPAPPAFEDLQIPQSAEGTKQAMDFGTVWSPDWMVLGVTGYRTEAIKRKVDKK